MDRERQTLELLQLLGDEVAEAVLERLQPERAQKLRAGLKADTPHRSTISRQREVLDEFECFFQFALKSKPPEPVAPPVEEPTASIAIDSATSAYSAGAGSSAGVGGATGAGPTGEAATAQGSAVESMTEPLPLSEEALAAEQKALLALQAEQNSVAEQNADQANAEHGSDLEDSMAATQTIPMSDNPLKDLETLSVHQIAQALGSEQSRTTAMLLSNLPAKLTGDILNLLKAEYQKLVMKELTKEQHAPAILVDRIARATFLRARQFSAEPPDTRNHADRVAEVLRSVPKAGRRNMLAAIEEQDPDLAKSLLTRIYRFDDITALNKAVVQRVLGEVDSTNLTTALFGAEESVKDAIFANLSKRARQTIEEEMQFMTNVSETRIQQARDAIAEVIAKIDMESES
jgi:flagellar motor switch protein FliG